MNLETLAAIAIVCILVGYCVRSSRIKTMCSPHFKCCHVWSGEVLRDNSYGITHRHACTKCGKVEITYTNHRSMAGN